MASVTLSSLDYIYKQYYTEKSVDYEKYAEAIKRLDERRLMWDEEARKWTLRIEREYNRQQSEVIENEFGIVSP